jgi:hypothetical protein
MARERRRRSRLAALTCCMLLTGCVSVTIGAAPVTPPSTSAAPTPSASPSPSASAAPGPDPETCTTRLSTYQLDVHSTGSVTAQDEQVVTAALRLAQRHFDVRVPECEPGEVSASVLDQENEHFAAGTFVQDVPHFRIEVYAGGRAWAQTPRSQVSLIMLHEWYHVVQYSFLDCEPPRCRHQVDPIPSWLIEGSAELEAAQAAQDERISFFSFVHRYELIRAAQVDTPLERLDQARTGSDYGLAFAAVDLLVDRAGSGALVEFWKEAGSTGRWERAFPRAFGTTPATFYRTFSAYRDRGFQT